MEEVVKGKVAEKEVKDNVKIAYKVQVEKLHDDVTFEGDICAYECTKLYQNFGSNGERLLENEHLKTYIDKYGLELKHLERAVISTGLKLSCNSKSIIQIIPDKELATTKGITMLASPVVVDDDEIVIVLINLSREIKLLPMGTSIGKIVVAATEEHVIEVK